jgi:hypothetical protein
VVVDEQRTASDGWTSADAAGLPILPGLLRWNEVRNGYVDHAIRFTTSTTSRHHVWPARHDAGATDSPAYPPMGARFRLRRSFATTGYGAHAKAVIAALKRYGLVLADKGSPWFFQGEQNPAWPDRLVSDLKRIPASAFVALDTRSMRVSSASARTRWARAQTPSQEFRAARACDVGAHVTARCRPPGRGPSPRPRG